jgi:serine/threonine-protein kinase
MKVRCPACTQKVRLGYRRCPRCGAALSADLPRQARGPRGEEDTDPELLVPYAVQPALFPPGRVLAGRYRVENILATGYGGAVLLGRNLARGRDVVLRMYSRPESWHRVRQRAAAVAGLHHPGILPILDVFELDGAGFLVQDYVEGGEVLRDHLRQGPLPMADVLELGAQLADVVGYLHTQSFLHLNLHPGQFLLTSDRRLLLIDFALEYWPGPDAHEGIILGVPPYLSPERVHGQRSGTADNVWAVGCILFEMLAGQRAFTAPSVLDVLNRIIQQEPDWSQLPAQTPPRLRELLRRCLQKKPGRRPQDLRAVARQIAEIAADPGAPVPGTRHWWNLWSLFSSR